MKVKKISEYSKTPKESISNQYNTKKHSFKEPGIKLLIGTRGTGKSFTTAKIMLEAKKEKLFDKTYFITPTFDSNKAHWSQFNILEEDVFYPNREAIGSVLTRIEQDRDEFEDYLVELMIYERFKRETKNKDTIAKMENENLMEYMNMGYVGADGHLNNKLTKPEWKYEHISGKIRPPTSLLIMDDVLGSTALSQSESFTKLCIQNRHIGALTEPYGDRQALGCSVIYSKIVKRMLLKKSKMSWLVRLMKPSSNKLIIMRLRGNMIIFASLSIVTVRLNVIEKI